MLPFYLSLIPDGADKSFFAEVYETYRLPMYHCAYAILKNESDAEDAVHDVFLAIAKTGVEKLRGAEADGALWAYLHIAVRNRSYSLSGRRGREEATEPESPRLSEPPKETPDSRTGYDALVDAVRALPPTYAETIYLSLVRDLSSAEIARLLGVSPAAVRQRIVKGKKLLREKLREDWDE